MPQEPTEEKRMWVHNAGGPGWKGGRCVCNRITGWKWTLKPYSPIPPPPSRSHPKRKRRPPPLTEMDTKATIAPSHSHFPSPSIHSLTTSSHCVHPCAAQTFSRRPFSPQKGVPVECAGVEEGRGRAMFVPPACYDWRNEGRKKGRKKKEEERKKGRRWRAQHLLIRIWWGFGLDIYWPDTLRPGSAESSETARRLFLGYENCTALCYRVLAEALK